MTLLVPDTHASKAQRTVRAAALSAAAAASLLLSAAAAGLGLGDIVQQSALGEPFRATVRVIADADEAARGELSPECFRLVAPRSEGSADLPGLVFGRATLAQGADGPRIIVASDAIASDPALSFALEAGCRLRVRREYTALLDPPIVRESVAASASPRAALAADGAPPSSRVRGSPMETKSAAPPRGQRAPTTATTTIATGDVRASSVGAPRNGSGTRLRGRTGAEAPPQLRVSRSASARGDPAARKKTDAEIRQEVEAETIVLQRRIAELSVTLARLDDELRAARAARDEAERHSRVPASQPGGIGSWFVPALLVAAALALIAMSLRALRTPTLRSIGMSPLVASTLGPAQSEISAVALKHGPARMPPARLPSDLDDSLQPAASEPCGYDDEASFDDDLIRYAEQRSAYSALEREQPKVVAAIVRDWGRSKVIAYLRDVLVSPRKPRGVFSREAVSDLIFLQALAMERAGYQAHDHPWRIELPVRRRA